MKSSRFVLIGLLAGLGTGWGQGAFAQKIYWTDVLYGRIQKADVGCLLGPNPSGCTVTVLDTLTVVPPTATHPGAKSPNSVTVDSNNVGVLDRRPSYDAGWPEHPDHCSHPSDADTRVLDSAGVSARTQPRVL